MESFESVVRFAFAVLVTGIWQAALLAGVAWLVLRSARSMNATTRHAVLASALLASLVLPIVTVSLTFQASGASPVLARPSTSAKADVPTAPSTKVVVGTQAAATRTTSSAMPAFERTRFVLPRMLVLASVAAWLIGALFVLARLVVSLVHLERLKRDALPLPIEYRQRLERWTGAAKGSREIRLCRSPDIAIPIAVGLFDAMILVPEQLVEELAPQDVDRILLHELAHLRRADDWFNAIERIAQALLFFNPGVQWVVRQLDLEREVACDDWVLAQTNEPLPYATCLAKVAEVTMWPYQAMAAPGAFVTRKSMSIRIERLLAAHRDVRIRLSYGPVGSAIVALIVLCIGAAYVAPSIAYPIAVAIAPVRVAPVHAKAIRHASLASTLPAGKPAGITGSVSVARTPSPTLPFTLDTHAATHVETHTATHVDARSAMNVDMHPHQPTIVADTVARAGYIDELASVGYTGLTLDELVQLKALGVTAAYIRRLEAAGFSHPSVRDLVQARALGVDGEYIRGIRQAFGGSPALGEFASLRALGVNAAYMGELASAGYPHLTLDQARQMRSLGIDGAFVRAAAAHGFHNLTVDQLVKLKVSGIL